MGPHDFVARARYRYAAMGPHGYGTDLSGDGATVTPVYEEDSDQVGAGSLPCGSLMFQIGVILSCVV